MAKSSPPTFDPAAWGAPGSARDLPPEGPEREAALRKAARGMLPPVFILPVLYFLICLPLALRLIGPNGAYGVRISATRASEAAWYDINAAAGWSGMVVSVLALAASALILKFAPVALVHRAAIALGVTVLAILLSLVVVL